MKVIINSPSLNPDENISGISSTVQFIILNNKKRDYIHFEVGRRDAESSQIYPRIKRILRNKKEYKKLILSHKRATIHYNIPLMTGAILRDYLLIREAHKAGNPIIIHIHGGKYLKERNRPFYVKWLLKKIFSWAQSIITLSEEESKILSTDFYLKNIHSLPNCIDTKEAQKHNSNNCDKKCLNILYIGRIEVNKGIEYIYESLKTVKEKGFDFVLHFAGKEETKGEYIPRFTETFKEQFIYHGLVSGKKKCDLLKESDIFLLPSFFEGLPISLLETMSYGCVPVITPVGSIPTIVKDRENGLFINIKDAEDTAAKLEELLSNKALLNKLSSLAKETIIEHFNEKTYIDRLNNIYKQNI